MSIRKLFDPDLLTKAMTDEEFVAFMNRHEPFWQGMMNSEIILAYKIWYHSKNYKPEPLNPTRLKDE
jgi:hypothetical protein